MSSKEKCGNITNNRECIKKTQMEKLKCAKTAKNEQGFLLLARIDL